MDGFVLITSEQADILLPMVREYHDLKEELKEYQYINSLVASNNILEKIVDIQTRMFILTPQLEEYFL